MTGPEHENDRLRDLFTASFGRADRGESCPADEEIWAASRGDLPPQRTRRLLAHSQDCDVCARSFSLAAEFVRTIDEQDVVRPFQRRRGSIVAIGALAAAVLIAIALSILMRAGPPPAGIPVLGESVQATLWRVRADGDEPLSGSDSLRVGDRLYLRLQSDVPVHLYVINTDGSGDSAALFPIEGAQWGNPLEAGTYRIPGETAWEHDSWEVSSAGGRETFQVIASRRPLERLESALERIDQASPGELVRGPGVLPEPGGADDLAAALRDLRMMPAEDIVVREVVLDNPR